MHMIKYTFIRPLSHSEVVALATRHWPMPCAIEIRNPTPHNIVYVEPTPEEAEALRLEYELFKKRTIDLPTPADK